MIIFFILSISFVYLGNKNFTANIKLQSGPPSGFATLPKALPPKTAGGLSVFSLIPQPRIHVRIEGQLIEVLHIFQRIERQLL